MLPKKQSGRRSRTFIWEIAIGLGLNMVFFVAWLQGVLEPQTWGIVNGILLTVRSISAMIAHIRNGGHASDPLQSFDPKKSIHTGLLIIMALLIAGCGVGVCSQAKMTREARPEGGHLLIVECGGKTVELELKKGTPACMEGCFDPSKRCEVE